MITFFKSAIFIYVALLIVLYFSQRALLYFPDRGKPPVPSGFSEISVRTSDGLNLAGAYSPSKEEGGITIVYFHGNGGHYAHRYFKVKPLLEQGYGVLFAEYRGYGGNAGNPTEQGLYNDARAYVSTLQNRLGKIVLYGESLGTGVAIQVATEYRHAVHGLILETPYSSIVDVAQRAYFFVPVRFLLKDKFDNLQKIDTLQVPKLFLHGKKDSVIPYDLSIQLFNKATEPKEFITFENGDHNNLPDFDSEKFVIEFLNRIKNGDFKATRTEGNSHAVP